MFISTWPPNTAADWKVRIKKGGYDWGFCNNGQGNAESDLWAVENFSFDVATKSLKLDVTKKEVKIGSTYVWSSSIG